MEFQNKMNLTNIKYKIQKYEITFKINNYKKNNHYENNQNYADIVFGN